MSPGPARDRFVRAIDTRAVSDVIPYGLGPLLETANGRARVTSWIDDLHARGARVILPIAGVSRLVALDAMVIEHPSTYFDGVITEYEFWNAPDRETAFATMLDLLREMRARRRTWNNDALTVGVYLGYPTPTEAARLATEIDFVALDYSVTTPERAWSKTYPTRGSLRARYAAFRGIERWPIFYATGEVTMKAATTARGRTVVESRFVRDAGRDREAAPAGFAYFTFEAMTE